MNIDPFTGEEFSPKRSNQKFANRANQIAYNNYKAKKLRDDKSEIDKALENNRRILENICGDGAVKIVSKDYLLGAGFKFRFFSHSIRYKSIASQAIYNYLIVPTEAKQFKIIKLP